MPQVIDRRSHFLWILRSIFRWALYQAKGIAAPDTPNFNDLRTDCSRYYTLTRLRNRVFYVAGTERTAVQTALHAVK